MLTVQPRTFRCAACARSTSSRVKPADVQREHRGADGLRTVDDVGAVTAADQRGAHPGQQGADGGQRLVVEGDDVDPAGQVARPHDLGQRLGGRHVLDLGLQRRLHRLHDLLEDRDPLALPGVQLAQLGQGALGDRPGTVGGPVHVRVVHHHERAVLAQMQIQFDDIEAFALGTYERAQGVLRLHAHDPAVSDGEKGQSCLASVGSVLLSALCQCRPSTVGNGVPKWRSA